MGEADLEHWNEMNSLLVGNGDYSQGAVMERPRQLIIEME